MPDLYHQFGSDITVGPTGDIAVIDGATLGVQRILRRLFTNQGDYIWHLDYGAGLPARVGDLIDPAFLSSLIRSQIGLEAAVAKTPAPVITVTPITNGVTVDIQYADGVTGQQNSLGFDVSQ